MVFSLKTNLADWSGLTAEGRLGAFRPNLALELHFARRWSVMASAAYSDWKGGRDHRFWGVSGYSLEPRLWLKGDGRYRWFYLGVYGQSGDFDYRPSPARRYGRPQAEAAPDVTGMRDSPQACMSPCPVIGASRRECAGDTSIRPPRLMITNLPMHTITIRPPSSVGA